MSIKRVISLIPSATEIICSIGAEDCLVGISHECDFPLSIQNLPRCTSSTINNELSSLEIDQKVHNTLLKGLSIYHLDFNLMKELKPDIIITQDQCKVCAISLNDLQMQMNTAFDYPVEIISIQPSSVSEIFDSIKTIATAIDKTDKLSEILESFQDRMEIIQHKVQFVKQRPTFVFIEWLEPLFSAGHWTPEIAENAGAQVLLSEKEKPSKQITWEELKSADPEFILIAPCGFPLERTKQEMHILINHPFWNELKAVKEKKIFIADGNHYFNRSGPRIFDSAEIIAEILQVNQFYFGMEGNAWEWYNN